MGVAAADARGHEAASNLAGILALPVGARPALYADMTKSEWSTMIARARIDLGSPYGLWQDDPAGFITWCCRDTIYSKQREICESVRDHTRTAVPSTHSASKMVADYEPVLTRFGWKNHGDLVVGDEVVAVDGTWASVLGVFPQPSQPLFRVAFNDRTWLDVGAEHLWTVRTSYASNEVRACLVCDAVIPNRPVTRHLCESCSLANGNVKRCGACLNALPLAEFTVDRAKADGLRTICRTCTSWNRARPDMAVSGSAPGTGKEWQVMTTAGLLAYGGPEPHGHRRASIPVCDPIVGVDWPLPVDPYVMGAMLGDGNMRSCCLTSADPEVFERVAQHYRLTRRDGLSWYLVGLRPTIRKLGLLMHRSWEKFVPSAFLAAPAAQRMALLQGLMDTDGSVDKKGSASFVSTSPRLAEDLAFLVRSLGGVARITPHAGASYAYLGERRVGRPSYQVSVAMTECPFFLPRKVERWVPSRRGVARKVATITELSAGPAACILIDHPSRTYLAGPALIATHNTFTGARLVAWWGAVWPLGSAEAITLAPTARQVRNIMWPSIRAAHRAAGLPGRVDQTQWMVGQTRLAYGMSPAPWDEAALQGIHNMHVLVIVDEAGGIGHVVGDALTALMSNPQARELLIGNPPTDEEGSWFEEQCANEQRVNMVRLSAFDTPNFTGEQTGPCTTCPPGTPPHDMAFHLTQREWVEEVKEDFGEDSAFYIARVLARFPKGMGRKVIPYAWVEQAVDPEHEPAAGGWVRIGADIASDGGDEFVIARAAGFTAEVMHRSSGAANVDPVQVAGTITNHVRDACALRAELIEQGTPGAEQLVSVKIDSSGLGWGVAGLVKTQVAEAGLPARVLPVRGEDEPHDETQFHNARSEMWWNTRRLMQPRDDERGGMIRLTGPARQLQQIGGQLQAPNYKNDSSGRIVVERKKDMRVRGVKSPDLADAINLAFYEPPGAGPAEIERPPMRAVPTRPTQMPQQRSGLGPRAGTGGAQVVPLGPRRA